jgi:hydrogenase maturation protease
MILVAGIGNIFFGDDAFGCEVASRMLKRAAAAGLYRNVRVVDFGIRGLDLAYALMEDFERVILVDATPRGGEPGTLYVIEPEIPDSDAAENSLVPHGMDPVRVLCLARSMGARIGLVRIVGCEPELLSDPEEGGMGLSARVEAAVEEAISIIDSLIQEIHV